MKKFALVGLVLFVVGVFGTMFSWQELIGRNRTSTIQRSIEVENERINLIDIDSDIAELNFFPTDEQTIQVDFSGKSNSSIDELLDVKESGDKLSITIDHKSKFFNISFFPFWNNNNPVLNIGIPKSFAGSIEAAVDVGEIQIDNLSLDQFVAVINVGELDGTNLVLNEARVEVNVGEIDLIGVTGDWDLSTDIGDIDLDLLEWQGNIEAYTDIGDIEIRIPDEPEFYSLRLETELGDVKGVADPIVEFRSTAGGEFPSLDASTDIGNITIKWGH